MHSATEHVCLLAPMPCMCLFTCAQVLRWSFLALRGDFNVNLAMTEEPHKMQITTEMMQVGWLVGVSVSS